MQANTLIRHLLLMILALFASNALSAPIAVDPQSIDAINLAGNMSIYADKDGKANIEQVSSEGFFSKFHPLEANSKLSFANSQCVWIRLELQSTIPAKPNWRLVIPMPNLEHVTYYSQADDGKWEKQSAGAAVAMNQWSRPGMYPEFEVSLDDSGIHTIYLQIRNSQNVTLTMHLSTAKTREFKSSLEFTGLGLMLGMLLTLTAICLVNFRQSNQPVDGWCAAYSLLAAVVIFTRTGLSTLWFWTDSPLIAEVASAAFPTLGVGFTMLLVRRVASVKARMAKRLEELLMVYAGVSVPLTILMITADRPLFTTLGNLYVASAPLVTLLFAFFVWRSRLKVGKWLFFSYIPHSIAVFIVVLQTLGYFPSGLDLHYMLLLAATLTVPIMLHLLNFKTQSRKEVVQRTEHLNTQDALTGLLNLEQFNRQVAIAIDHSISNAAPSAIVLVDVVNFQQLRTVLGDQGAEQCLLRAVVKLHRILRDVDPAARIGSARFGLILDGVKDRQLVVERMVRLIASGLIPLPGLQPEATLHFHVACSMLSEYSPDAQSILGHLGDVLDSMNPRTRRPIRFLEPLSTIPGPVPAGADLNTDMAGVMGAYNV